jgi:hypothetical protein
MPRAGENGLQPENTTSFFTNVGLLLCPSDFFVPRADQKALGGDRLAKILGQGTQRFNELHHLRR